MKGYWLLAGVAFAILAVSAIWLGGLNQDEGLYLYAAKLLGEGQRLYADVPCTQGPIMPTIYAALSGFWLDGGILSARILTCVLGAFSIFFAVGIARLIVPADKKSLAGLLVFLLLGCNLYHVYYLSIPKVYAVATLFLMIGFYLFAFAFKTMHTKVRYCLLSTSAFALAFAAGTRLSLGMCLLVTGVFLLAFVRRLRWSFLWFGLGGVLGLALIFMPYLCDEEARLGLAFAQYYHTARAGGGILQIVGSLSRLVRWYLPILILLGVGIGMAIHTKSIRWGFVPTVMLGCFVGVFVMQLMAPCPYDDYQVPIMGLLALYAVGFGVRVPYAALLTLGLCLACSFGSPLWQEWTTNGHDRFWPRLKTQTELAQLREVARTIEALEPEGDTLLTQDLYLAIETNRKVPKGLEMGPFAMLSDEAWRALVSSAPAEVAALSGYTFAIEPPQCAERALEAQLDYWTLLKERYRLILKEDDFGQHATTLLILKRKEEFAP